MDWSSSVRALKEASFFTSAATKSEEGEVEVICRVFSVHAMDLTALGSGGAKPPVMPGGDR
jgi:hypothetical protein